MQIFTIFKGLLLIMFLGFTNIKKKLCRKTSNHFFSFNTFSQKDEVDLK